MLATEVRCGNQAKTCNELQATVGEAAVLVLIEEKAAYDDHAGTVMVEEAEDHILCTRSAKGVNCNAHRRLETVVLQDDTMARHIKALRNGLYRDHGNRTKHFVPVTHHILVAILGNLAALEVLDEMDLGSSFRNQARLYLILAK